MVWTGQRPVKTSSDHDWSGPVFGPQKDRKRYCGPVFIGPVRFFLVFKNRWTGPGPGPSHLGVKDRTGPDFQALGNGKCPKSAINLF